MPVQNQSLSIEQIRYVADLVIQARIAGFMTSAYIFGGALSVVLGFAVRLILKRQSEIRDYFQKVTNMHVDVEKIISHEEGKESFSRGLYRLAGDYGIVKSELENLDEKIDFKTDAIEKKIDRLVDAHERMLCMQWDGKTERRSRESEGGA